MAPTSPRIDPVIMFVAAAVIAGLAGVAAMLREPAALSVRAIFSSFLNSSLFGLAVALIWNQMLPAGTGEWIPLAFAIVVGLAGNKSIDYAQTMSGVILSKMMPKALTDDAPIRNNTRQPDSEATQPITPAGQEGPKT